MQIRKELGYVPDAFIEFIEKIPDASNDIVEVTTAVKVFLVDDTVELIENFSLSAKYCTEKLLSRNANGDRDLSS